MMADLAAARESQMRRKLMAQAVVAEVEQAEFRRVLEVNREKQMQDMSQVRRMWCAGLQQPLQGLEPPWAAVVLQQASLCAAA